MNVPGRGRWSSPSRLSFGPAICTGGTRTPRRRSTLATGSFYFFALAVETLISVSMVIFLVTLCRYANRSREADRYEKWLRTLPPEKLPSVDVFLTTYNEGREFVERGIVAAKALDYPRFTVWVLDDGKSRLAPRPVRGAQCGVRPPPGQ